MGEGGKQVLTAYEQNGNFAKGAKKMDFSLSISLSIGQRSHRFPWWFVFIVGLGVAWGVGRGIYLPIVSAGTAAHWGFPRASWLDNVVPGPSAAQPNPIAGSGWFSISRPHGGAISVWEQQGEVPSGGQTVVLADTGRLTNRWEEHVRKFEQMDRHAPPPPGGILFVGSSSIVRWNLKQFFPDLPVINRGFGGSHLSDVVYFADRIVLPYQPKIIVLYAGDNDLAAGKTPEQVAADYEAFVKKVHQTLPKTRIIYISIKPSIARWHLIEKIRQANALIAARAGKDDRLLVVNIEKAMLGPDGTPKKELFQKDGLHLSEAGYKIWADLLRPHLKLQP